MLKERPIDGSFLPEEVGLNKVFEYCRSLGIWLSRQRRIELDLLWSEKNHLTAKDIFAELNVCERTIGHTSVDQNLEVLQSAVVIECLDRAIGRLYGYRSHPHSLLTCLDIGEILDMEVVLPLDLLIQIERRTGFRIESYTLHLNGRRTLEV